MAARSRLQVLIVSTAVAALAIPVSSACASTFSTSSSHRSTLYLSHTMGLGKGRLTATRPTARHWALNRTDTLAGWVEVRPGGTAQAVASVKPKAPDGHGWLWSDASLAGDTVAAGTWRPTLSLKAAGALTVTPRVRVYRLSNHGYTLITESTGKSVRLTSRAKKITLPGVKVPALSFSTGDRLYVDVIAKVTVPGTAAGNGILVLDNAGAAGSLTLPVLTHHVVEGQPRHHPHPTPSVTPTGPTVTTRPTTTPTARPTHTGKPTPTPTKSTKPTPRPTHTPKPKPPAVAPTTTAAPPVAAPPTTTAPPVTSGSVWHPKPGTTWQWQITGTVDPSLNVDMYDIDLFDAQSAASSYSVPGFGTVNVPKGPNAGVIPTLHAAGKVVVCYLDSGAYESYRPDASLFPAAIKGGSTGWDGESWLDIRPASWSQFEPIIAARFALAKRSGCDGVEPDENNPLGNNPGFPITQDDQQAWYLEVARLAHADGLSVGMKNGIETTDAATIAAFDWDLNEECNKYSECSVLDGFISAGKAVFQVEYQDEGMTTSFCSSDNAQHFSGLLMKLALNGWREAC